MVVRRCLRQAFDQPHDIAEASNGVDALVAIAADEPDLVLSDWNMPDMDGIDLLAALRAEGRTIKFGFVTSEGSPAMRERASAGGALFLITKPFSPETFQTSLMSILGGK